MSEPAPTELTEIIVVRDGPHKGSWVQLHSYTTLIAATGGLLVHPSVPGLGMFCGELLMVAPSEEHWQRMCLLAVAGIAEHYDFDFLTQ